MDSRSSDSNLEGTIPYFTSVYVLNVMQLLSKKHICPHETIRRENAMTCASRLTLLDKGFEETFCAEMVLGKKKFNEIFPKH